MRRNIFRYWFVPGILLLYWATMSFVFNNGVSFSVITYDNKVENEKNIQNKKLYKNDKILVVFTSQDKNLGMVFIPFKSIATKIKFDEEDELIFRLREKEKGIVLVENEYRSGLLYGSRSFPFGFSPIKNSKGKTYEIELTSLKGSEKNHVTIDDASPVLSSGYKYEKSELLADKNELVRFIVKRNIASLKSSRSMEFIFNSFVYLLPFALYVIWLKSPRQKRIGYVRFSVILLTVFISLCTFFMANLNNIVILQFYFLWTFVILLYKLESNITYFFCFIFLITSVFFIIFHSSIILVQEILTFLAFLLLVIGTMQAIFEIRRPLENGVSLSSFLGYKEK